jgi:hypothetical protein
MLGLLLLGLDSAFIRLSSWSGLILPSMIGLRLLQRKTQALGVVEQRGVRWKIALFCRVHHMLLEGDQAVRRPSMRSS